MKIVIVAGAAGTGKSTLGLAMARELGLPMLDLDSITNPVLDALIVPIFGGDHWNSDALRPALRPARYASLAAAARDQVRAGVGAVLVAPFTREMAGASEWASLVAAVHPARPEVVWLTAPTELLTARRTVRGEIRDAHIADPPVGSAPAVPHLRLDADLATGEQIAATLGYLGRHRALPADSPVFSRTFDAVLFDLDGTLIDSTPSVLRSWDTLGREFGFDADLAGSGHGQPAAQLIASFLPDELVATALARIIELESNDLHDVTAFHGSADFLTALPHSAKAIVTSGTRVLAAARIEAAGIPRPHTVVTFDDVTRGKPDPEPFLLAARLLGVDPTKCLVFEDAPAGLTAARAAGCTTVAVAGTHPDVALEADLVVDGLHQLAIETVADGYRIVRS